MLKRTLPVVSTVLGFAVLLIVVLACGGGPGGTLCDQPIAPPHASASGCTLVCDPGWFNCDNDSKNGCETSWPCSNKSVDGSSPSSAGPQLVAILSGEPRGIAACGTSVFYLDGDTLSTPAGVVFTLPRTPAGGLACSGNTRSMLVLLTEDQAQRVYKDGESTYYVLDGQGSVKIGDRDGAVTSGSFVSVPRGMPFTITVNPRSKKPLAVLWVLSGERCEAAR